MTALKRPVADLVFQIDLAPVLRKNLTVESIFVQSFNVVSVFTLPTHVLM